MKIPPRLQNRGPQWWISNPRGRGLLSSGFTPWVGMAAEDFSITGSWLSCLGRTSLPSAFARRKSRFQKSRTWPDFTSDEIRKFQPKGPYYLGGFCFGGNVAFEMAQHLSNAGQEVGLLVMLETAPPNINQKQSWSATATKYRLRTFWRM